jgi:hypothetical protein
MYIVNGFFRQFMYTSGSSEDIPMSKKSMTLNLTDPEMAALEKLSQGRDMSKTAVIRQALRMYQLIDSRLSKGEKLYFEDELTKEKKEVVVL